jgi:hypothetical protein
MRRTPEELISDLSQWLDPANARVVITEYLGLQKRFIAGDWQPAELKAGRLCEAVARCVLQVDREVVDHRLSVARITEKLRDETVTHYLSRRQREHVLKAIGLIYKFRSDRGAVHISPKLTANYMDSMLVVHCGKWLLAEFLGLAFLRYSWAASENELAELIEQLVQLEHSLVHEIDGKPLVLAKGISALDEVLILLFWEPNNRLTRGEIRQFASGQAPQNIALAITRLLKSKEIRASGDSEIALTPNGQKRIIEAILPRLALAHSRAGPSQQRVRGRTQVASARA